MWQTRGIIAANQAYLVNAQRYKLTRYTYIRRDDGGFIITCFVPSRRRVVFFSSRLFFFFNSIHNTGPLLNYDIIVSRFRLTEIKFTETFSV